MKTRSLWLLGLLALILVFAGCSSGGGEDYSISLADPSQLSTYSGDDTYSSNTEAKNSAATVDAEISDEIDKIQNAVSSAISAAESKTTNFSNTYPATLGGNFVVTGSSTYSYPDNYGSGTYSFRMNYNADVNNVSIDPDNSGSPYTVVDGQNAANYAVTMQVTQTSSGATINVSVQGQFGWALSVSSVDSNVKSGKYILLVNMSGGGTITVDSDGNITGATEFADAVSISGSLKIYNNSNQLIREATLTASDLATDQNVFNFYN